MQFLADVLGVPCVRPTVPETTALGAAFLAGLGVGFWESTDAIRDAWVEDRRFLPRLAPAERAAHLARWAEAVKRA
jgi:glycerol kinase